MHRNNQSNFYRRYSYLLSSRSTYSQENNYHQYHDPRSHNLNRTPTVAHALPRFRQQYKSSTAISDLTEPMSVFDDIKVPRHRQFHITSFPSVHTSSNLSRQTSLSDARLATASAVRERLLNQIQHNISEIDQELSSLERRPSIARHIPVPFSSIDQKTPSLDDDNQIKSNKPKRIHRIIPHITSQPKSILQQSSRKRTDEINSHSYISHYHYASEIEEREIAENDPENCDLKSTIGEIPKLSSQKTFSLDQFRREQSDLSQNRALIFVPEYGDTNKIEFNKTAEDSHQNNPTETNIAQPSTIKSSQNFTSVNKLNIQTASEPKIKIPSPRAVKPDKISDKNEVDLVNTMFSKPVRHDSLSRRILTKIQEELTSYQEPTISPVSSRNNNISRNNTYSVNDFGNEYDIVEAHLSITPGPSPLLTGPEIIADNINQNIIKHFQPSYSEQQLIITNFELI